MNRKEYSISNKHIKHKKNFISFFILYIIFTFLIYTLPYTKVKVPYVISGSLMLGFLPIAILKKRQWKNFTILLVLLSFFIFLLDFFIGGYSIIDSLNEMIRNIRFYTPVLWTLYILIYCRKEEYKYFFISFISIVSVILYKTLNALETNQWITRILAKAKTQDTLEIRAYRLQNVGGFEFSYMMGIVIICLVWTALKARNKFVKVICLCAAGISYYYIIQTMYTTLLILTSISVLILIIFNIRNKGIKLTIIIVFFILIFGLIPFLEFLSSIFVDSLLSTKFMQIHDALIYGNLEALGSRPQHILDALENWMNSPILGGYNVGNKNHSTIIGLLEKNGLVGLGAYIFLYYKAWKILKFNLKYNGYNYFLVNIVFFYTLLLSFFNPIGYIFEITISTFFVAPLWSIIFQDMDRIKKR